MSAEQCLRVSAGGASAALPTILLVPPLFDEANRMRRTLVLTMRALADLGHASLLPDLPGQNDSLIETQDVTLQMWRDALAGFAAAHSGPFIIASWRGGALIDDAAANAIGWWRMAPVTGASIVKTLIRVRIAGEKEAGRSATAEQLREAAGQSAVDLGGNRLTAKMLAGLDAATPAPVSPLLTRSPSDVAGSALWLRAEPGEDAGMAGAMAADIAAWAK
ncbi:MAG: hypothetical protein ABL874_01145 [Sphingopyxis sp.]